MHQNQTTSKRILVAGDVTMDWFIAMARMEKSGRWTKQVHSKLWRAPGGAALLAHLVESLINMPDPGDQIACTLQPCFTLPADVVEEDRRIHHAYSLWTPFAEKGLGNVWRIERYLGSDPAEETRYPAATDLGSDPIAAEMLLINDQGLGFRDQPQHWRSLLDRLDPNAWVLLKMTKPVVRGPLWNYLLDHRAERMIVLTTIDDLRQSEVQISRQLSWERTAQDILWELTHNPSVNGFSRCAQVVISLGAAGAILLSRRAQEARLFFDAQHMEDEWEQQHPGAVFGDTTCLATAICRQWMLQPEQPDFSMGIQTGVAAIRRLHLSGFGRANTDPQDAQLRFPAEEITQAIVSGECPLVSTMIQDPVQNILAPSDGERLQVTPGLWTILEDTYTDTLTQVGERIVLEGIDRALKDVPIGRFAALVTVDRREIEALRGIRTLISQYCQKVQARPLSIAVFGPPGSGKSFAVKQIAKSARPGEIQPITFNLSQFRHPDEILDALHQVRDIGLSGKAPLVFWDEFDSSLDGKPLGWLRYFLAPMQDGAFQQGQIVHPIGRAIFVFAGGTSHRMQEFGSNLAQAEQRAAKLPDFISRLKGYLDVLGPNPIQGKRDPYYILRRAIILRVLFEVNAPQILAEADGVKRVQIDRGILRAFLQTNRFTHGVRSIESIIAMSNLAGKATFERSDLPPENQLDLHVEGRAFLALVQQMPLDGELLERLAEAAHEVFCDGLRAQGYQVGAQTDRDRKIHDALRPYRDLREEDKQANRDSVRDIPNKLAAVGYVMMPARSNEPPFEFPGDDLDLLAQMEHARWMRDKKQRGWQFGEKTDKDRKVHESLEQWASLSEEEREKDREMVRGIPRILAKAGYAIVKV